MKNKKGKAKTSTILIVIAVLIVLGMLAQKQFELFVITGSETTTRTSSSTSINPSSTFQVTYTVSGATGQWGGSVEETITGGCTINGQTTLRFVMMSDLPNPLIYTATAPASGSCTFTGNYKFGTGSTINFPDLIINVCQRNTEADTNCDNSVDRNELGLFIIKWIDGQATRDALGQAIVAWIG